MTEPNLVGELFHHIEERIRTAAPGRLRDLDFFTHDGDVVEVHVGVAVAVRVEARARAVERAAGSGRREHAVHLPLFIDGDRDILCADFLVCTTARRSGVGPVGVVRAGVEVVEPELVVHARAAERRNRADLVQRGFVTVVIEAVVGDIGGTGVDREDRIVAVRAAGCVATRHRAVRAMRVGEIAVAVAVAVQVRDGGRETLVHGAVAVVIEAIARLASTRIDAARRIVAVSAHISVADRSAACHRGRRRHTVPIAVAIQVEGRLHALVRGTVTVVVRGVARLGRAGVNRAARVVAVRVVDNHAGRHAARTGSRTRAVPIQVTIGVVVHEQKAVVFDAITVLVVTVARFRATGIVEDVAVIAVVVVRDVHGRSRARHVRHRRVAVAVGVAVQVEREFHTFVDAVGAVVVDLVAHLGLAGVDGDDRVVAVGIVLDVAIHGGVAGHRTAAAVVTEGVGISVGIPRPRHTVVHRAVAVVVDSVALFGGIRVDRSSIVVAVRVDVGHVVDFHEARGPGEGADVGRAGRGVFFVDVARADGRSGEHVAVTVLAVDLRSIVGGAVAIVVADHGTFEETIGIRSTGHALGRGFGFVAGREGVDVVGGILVASGQGEEHECSEVSGHVCIS